MIFMSEEITVVPDEISLVYFGTEPDGTLEFTIDYLLNGKQVARDSRIYHVSPTRGESISFKIPEGEPGFYTEKGKV